MVAESVLGAAGEGVGEGDDDDDEQDDVAAALSTSANPSKLAMKRV
jgi:hypothetical protein